MVTGYGKPAAGAAFFHAKGFVLSVTVYGKLLRSLVMGKVPCSRSEPLVDNFTEADFP